MSLAPDRRTSLLRSLASPVDDEPSLEAAREMLSAPNPSAVLSELYPSLVADRVLTNATHHLERAGGDVGALRISNDRFPTTWPLPALFPPDLPELAGDVSLSVIRELLDGHRRAVDQEMAFLIEALPLESFMALTGRAFRAGYPGYALRMEYDADVFAWDIDEGLAVLDAVRSSRGCSMHSARVFRVNGRWHAELHTARLTEDHRELHVDIQMGAKMGRSRPIGPEPRRDRARNAKWGGGTVLIPAPEDLLLWSVVQQRRRSTLSLRDLNDARTVLEADGAEIDWDHLCRSAAQFDVAPLVRRLVEEAERATGRRLAPDGVHEQLVAAAGSAGRGELAVGIRTAQSETAAGRAVIPEFILAGRGRRRDVGRFVSSITALLRAGPRSAWPTIRSKMDARLLSARGRLGRSSRPGAAPTLRLLRRLDRASGSLCELRARPMEPGDGFCLSRSAGARRPFPRVLGGRGRAVLEAFVQALPDRAEQENVRIRPSEDGESWTAHRCPAFTYLVE